MPHPNQGKSLLDYFEQTYVSQHLTRQSAKAMRAAVRRFLAFQGDDVTVGQPTRQTLTSFHEWLVHGLKVKKVTAANYVRHVRMILRTARPDEFPYEARSRRVAPKRRPEGERDLHYVLHQYCQERPLRVRSIEQIEFSIESLSKYLGRRATLDDLNHEVLNPWLVQLSATLAAKTVKGRRANIITLWRYAYDEAGLVWNPPKRVRKIKVPYTFPSAWTGTELAKLYAAADKFKGTLKDGTPLRDFWRAYIAVAYDTGLRPCDLLVLRRDAIGSDGTVAIVQEKTGLPLVARVRPETLAAVRALKGPADQPVFRSLQTKHGIYFTWEKLLASAGLTGSPKKLRKTSATLLETVSPGTASAHLGHLTPGLAQRNYIDPRVVAAVRPLPPAIGRAERRPAGGFPEREGS